jgi:Copper transport outer membrane protein, MctB
VRTDDDLATRVTTVDDLDLVAGRVATVLSLQDLVAGVVGHYGYGDGATSPLPPRPDGS